MSQVFCHIEVGWWESPEERGAFKQLMHNAVYIPKAKHLIKTGWRGLPEAYLASTVWHHRREYKAQWGCLHANHLSVLRLLYK